MRELNSHDITSPKTSDKKVEICNMKDYAKVVITDLVIFD